MRVASTEREALAPDPAPGTRIRIPDILSSSANQVYSGKVDTTPSIFEEIACRLHPIDEAASQASTNIVLRQHI
jgi:hypothetical protein